MRIRRRSTGDIVFDILNNLFMLIIVIITLYPFYYIIISSFNDPIDLLKGPVYLWPRKFSVVNYIYIFQEKAILNATFITVARTVIGSATAVLFTAAFAYGISRKWLIGRKLFIKMAIVTMYFSGGLIPTYLLITRFLNLAGNFLVFIIPNLFNAYNAFIMYSFFKGIPVEIEESAKIDGANDIIIFFKLILPLSLPILATIALFNGVWHWNSWFDALLYGEGKLETLPLYLVRAIQSATASAAEAGRFVSTTGITSTSIRLTTMVVTTFPITIVYPFLQKYFVKGIMIGALKD
ncbi:binding-protein-dependent transport systems inner membrane component [Caldicellulosiruptor kronotskyensis 2002]|uniref:Binding-protein-dependent transport systems inner membrane component n=1 Tax=Caldicellulosiruptor kronotskyensis (strain DSM 18902 / VKM B-2412 / 2002) TaxID=632348 RepID=E4SEH8_CALK2|nr:carbohydrate ABC transporter permease [Caldicellulosiruptor kronotskyensis]ADQ45465.1 binding-protein-dependent transport systems inner membrane component [Caldicellulosiruptor kronotskyensis 2002]